MRALLFQPPVYDTQYYAEWSMPSGLLKVATWLRELGYDLRLLDCLYPDAKGEVKQEIRKVVQVCSTLEWTLADYRAMVKDGFRERFATASRSVSALSDTARRSSADIDGSRIWTTPVRPTTLGIDSVTP